MLVGPAQHGVSYIFVTFTSMLFSDSFCSPWIQINRFVPQSTKVDTHRYSKILVVAIHVADVISVVIFSHG